MAGVALTAAMQAGNRERALAASRYITDPEQRQNRLRECGFLTELAEVSPSFSATPLDCVCLRFGVV